MQVEYAFNTAVSSAFCADSQKGNGVTLRAVAQHFAAPSGLTGKKGMQSDDANSAEELKRLIVLIGVQRDRSAFRELYAYFAPRVKSFLVTRGLTPTVADDVLQEVMLAIWQKADTYQPEKAALSTWVFTIARYKYIDRLRREGRHQAESDEPDLRASDDMHSDDEVLQEQRKLVLQEAIARLPEEQQSVIFLSFSKGLAHSEIAEQLGLPLGTVKSRIRRAFQRLREDLPEELGEVS